MNDEELKESLYLLEFRKNQLSQLAKQAELLELSANENLRVKETLVNYKNANENDEFLVPLGAEVFIPMKMKKKGRAVASVGADVVVEGDIDNVVKGIDSRIKMLNDASKRIVESMEKMQNEINTLSEKVEKGYSEMKHV